MFKVKVRIKSNETFGEDEGRKMSPEPTPVQAISHGVKYLGDNYCRYGCLVLIISQFSYPMLRGHETRFKDIFRGPQTHCDMVIFVAVNARNAKINSTHPTHIIGGIVCLKWRFTEMKSRKPFKSFTNMYISAFVMTVTEADCRLLLCSFVLFQFLPQRLWVHHFCTNIDSRILGC